jgi:hypothetical protein
MKRNSERKKAASGSERAAFLFVRMAAVAIATLLLAAGAMKAQRPAGPMDGTWFNVDPATRGLTSIQIQGNVLHPYGSCHPQACDWGAIKAKGFANDVNSGGFTALRAKANQGFATKEIVATLEPDGRLRVEVFTHFTDDSKRPDYRAVDYFARGREQYRH